MDSATERQHSLQPRSPCSGVSAERLLERQGALLNGFNHQPYQGFLIFGATLQAAILFVQSKQPKALVTCYCNSLAAITPMMVRAFPSCCSACEHLVTSCIKSLCSIATSGMTLTVCCAYIAA
jgi:hypothetical protein